MFKGRHFDRSVILLCVRWYLAYNLSLRDLEEMMAERGLNVDHSTVHRWVVHFSPQLLERFNRRKRAIGIKWHMDDRRIKRRIRPMLGFKSMASAEISLRQRDGAHDAQTTGEVCLQSTSVNRRAIRDPNRLSPAHIASLVTTRICDRTPFLAVHCSIGIIWGVARAVHERSNASRGRLVTRTECVIGSSRHPLRHVFV